MSGEDGEEKEEERKAGIRSLCMHMFHFECLAKWSDASCPVCRASTQPCPPSSCEECDAVTGLWMCIVCGSISCSIHSPNHFKSTNHPFAVSVGGGNDVTPTVWDHASRSYVSRLMLTADGKPVEYSSRSRRFQHPAMMGISENSSGTMEGSGGLGQDTGEELTDSEHANSLKLEQIAVEFNYLLKQQLAQQRTHFERRLMDSRQQANRKTELIQGKLRQLRALNQEVFQRLDGAQQRLVVAQKKKKALSSELEAVKIRRERMQSLNTELLKRQENKRKKVETARRLREEDRVRRIKLKEAKIQELQEQIHDLRSFLKTRGSVNKAKRGGGTVVDVAINAGKSGGRRGERKRGRRRRSKK
mmetsp:Transcript_2103/g.3116  ORF Transcript_2103/g.3116 Transcript_2103/m.3116 type:complete len:360 (+) Transcript_2103:323-1402(+)